MNKTERVDKKKLEKAIETTNFKVLKEKENKEGFDEAPYSTVDKKESILNLTNNNWKNY